MSGLPSTLKFLSLRTFMMTVMAVTVSTCLSMSLLAAEQPATDVTDVADASDAPAEPTPEEMQKMYEQMAKLGPEHELLKQSAGEWTAETKMFAAGSDEPVMTDKAKSTNKLVMGGRYLQHNFEGTFAGQPFLGRGLSGYDNIQKKYVGTWIDNMGTGIMQVEGTWDAKTKTMTETGVTHTPLGVMKHKMVTTHTDKDHMTFTMYTILPTGPQKQMVIEYTRKK